MYVNYNVIPTSHKSRDSGYPIYKISSFISILFVKVHSSSHSPNRTAPIVSYVLRLNLVK